MGEDKHVNLDMPTGTGGGGWRVVPLFFLFSFFLRIDVLKSGLMSYLIKRLAYVGLMSAVRFSRRCLKFVFMSSPGQNVRRCATDVQNSVFMVISSANT